MIIIKFIECLKGGTSSLSKEGIISLGEAFVDLISTDQTNTRYRQFLGGATVNVAVGTSRFGIPSYYLCKLGTDENSLFVAEALKKENINIDYCVSSPEKKVCSVYIHLDENGDRYFHKYVNETPDEWLTVDELEKETFHAGKIFYFSSGTLFNDKARKTTEQALTYAEESQMLVAFDANIRLKRWESEEECRERVSSFLKRADLVKLTEDELLFLTETSTMEEGLVKISNLNIPFLFITMGEAGACVLHDGKRMNVPGIKVKAVDTTGAGDAFFAAVLSRFHEKGVPVDDVQLKEYVQFANKIGAIATTKIGSL